MGLLVNIYRDKYDATNGGLSSQVDRICVVNMDGPFEPGEDAPAFEVVGGPYGSAKLVPVDQPSGVIGPMMGGNYGATSDSRFGRKIEEILGHKFYGALPIHDRFESPEQNDLLSR